MAHSVLQLDSVTLLEPDWLPAYTRSYQVNQCLHHDLFVRTHGCWHSLKSTFNQPGFHLQMLTL